MYYATLIAVPWVMFKRDLLRGDFTVMHWIAEVHEFASDIFIEPFERFHTARNRRSAIGSRYDAINSEFSLQAEYDCSYLHQNGNANFKATWTGSR